jgi:hypothetical protein
MLFIDLREFNSIQFYFIVIVTSQESEIDPGDYDIGCKVSSFEVVAKSERKNQYRYLCERDQHYREPWCD